MRLDLTSPVWRKELERQVLEINFLVFFGVIVAAQMTSKQYHPFLYWSVVVATTTVGTTLSDYLDRTIGLGYVKSSIALFCSVLIVLLTWRYVTGASSLGILQEGRAFLLDDHSSVKYTRYGAG